MLPKKMIETGYPKMCIYNGKYMYPPKLQKTPTEIQLWISTEVLHFDQHELSKNYMIDKVIYWRLSEVACNLIKFDSKWFDSVIPRLKQFWNYVLFYRKYPAKLDKLVTYIEEVGSNKTAEIFKKIHKDYVAVNTDSKLRPLYQEENEWRTKYNKKAQNWQKYQKYQASKKK